MSLRKARAGSGLLSGSQPCQAATNAAAPRRKTGTCQSRRVGSGRVSGVSAVTAVAMVVLSPEGSAAGAGSLRVSWTQFGPGGQGQPRPAAVGCGRECRVSAGREGKAI